MRKPTTRARGAYMTLEVVERHVFTVTDGEIATQLRQALASDDIERLAELIDFLNIDGPGESGVLTVTEVKR